eukprot:jgi/Botrbrau1/2877/Bobra.0036s0022.1
MVLVRRYKEYHGRRCRYVDCLDMPGVPWDSTRLRGKEGAAYQCIPLDAINRLILMQKAEGSISCAFLGCFHLKQLSPDALHQCLNSLCFTWPQEFALINNYTRNCTLCQTY